MGGDIKSGKMLKLFCLVLVAMATKFQIVDSTAEALSHATAHFGRSLEECREESGLGEDIMDSFHKFWSEEFDVVQREVGCAIICMSNKFQLMHDDANMHHGNMTDYIRSFPDGDKLAGLMVQLIHECELKYQDITDKCMMVTKTAACFKKLATKSGIAPELAMIEAVMEHYL